MSWSRPACASMAIGFGTKVSPCARSAGGGAGTGPRRGAGDLPNRQALSRRAARSCPSHCAEIGAVRRHRPSLRLPGPESAPVAIDSVMGLGSRFSAASFAARLRRPSLGIALRLAAGRKRGRVIVQNPEDRDALMTLGIVPRQIVMIRGSGVDCHHFRALPDPTPRPSRLRSSRACCATRACSTPPPQSASSAGAASRSNSCSPDRPIPTIAAR